MHDQYNVRAAITFPTTRHHRRLASTKLHYLVTDVHTPSAWHCCATLSDFAANQLLPNSIVFKGLFLYLTDKAHFRTRSEQTA